MFKIGAILLLLFLAFRVFAIAVRQGQIPPPPGARYRVTLYQDGKVAKVWFASEVLRKKDGFLLTDAATSRSIALPSSEGVVLEDLASAR